jgi:superfamily I DNA/RNA helicase
MVSFVAGDERGLVRIAEFPEYQIPLPDVRRLLALARERRQWFPQALELVDEADALSAAGRRGLQLLRSYLEGITSWTDAWKLLTRYLFERCGYVRHLLHDESVSAQQQDWRYSSSLVSSGICAATSRRRIGEASRIHAAPFDDWSCSAKSRTCGRCLTGLRLLTRSV